MHRELVAVCRYYLDATNSVAFYLDVRCRGTKSDWWFYDADGQEPDWQRGLHALSLVGTLLGRVSRTWKFLLVRADDGKNPERVQSVVRARRFDRCRNLLQATTSSRSLKLERSSSDWSLSESPSLPDF